MPHESARTPAKMSVVRARASVRLERIGSMGGALW